MPFDRIREKLSILSDTLKYNVFCTKRGSKRTNIHKGIGNNTGIKNLISILKMSVVFLYQNIKNKYNMLCLDVTNLIFF